MSYMPLLVDDQIKESDAENGNNNIVESQEDSNQDEQEISEKQLDNLHSFVAQHWSAFADNYLDIQSNQEEPLRWAFNDTKLLYMTAQSVSDKLLTSSNVEFDTTEFTLYTVILYEKIFASMITQHQEIKYDDFERKFKDRFNTVKDQIERYKLGDEGDQTEDSLTTYIQRRYDKATKLNRQDFDSKFGHLFRDNWWESLPDNNALKYLYEETGGDIDEKKKVFSIEQRVFDLVQRINGDPKYNFADIYQALSNAEYAFLKNPSENEFQLEVIYKISLYLNLRTESFTLDSEPQELLEKIETIDNNIINELLRLGIIDKDTGEINPYYKYIPSDAFVVEIVEPEETEGKDETSTEIKNPAENTEVEVDGETEVEAETKANNTKFENEIEAELETEEDINGEECDDLDELWEQIENERKIIDEETEEEIGYENNDEEEYETVDEVTEKNLIYTPEEEELISSVYQLLIIIKGNEEYKKEHEELLKRGIKLMTDVRSNDGINRSEYFQMLQLVVTSTQERLNTDVKKLSEELRFKSNIEPKEEDNSSSKKTPTGRTEGKTPPKKDKAGSKNKKGTTSKKKETKTPEIKIQEIIDLAEELNTLLTLTEIDDSSVIIQNARIMYEELVLEEIAKLHEKYSDYRRTNIRKAINTLTELLSIKDEEEYAIIKKREGTQELERLRKEVLEIDMESTNNT